MKAKYLLLLLGWLFLAPLAAKAQTFDGARVYRTTNQAIPNNTATAVGWTAESYDAVSPYHSLVSNITRMTVSAVGYYRLTANVYFEANGAGLRVIQIRRNGTDIVGYCTWEPESATDIQIQQCQAEWFEGSPTSYYEVFVYQNSGVSRDIVADGTTGPGTTWFAIQYMGN